MFVNWIPENMTPGHLLYRKHSEGYSFVIHIKRLFLFSHLVSKERKRNGWKWKHSINEYLSENMQYNLSIAWPTHYVDCGVCAGISYNVVRLATWEATLVGTRHNGDVVGFWRIRSRASTTIYTRDNKCVTTYFNTDVSRGVNTESDIVFDHNDAHNQDENISRKYVLY